jgi:hypothetical protein
MAVANNPARLRLMIATTVSAIITSTSVKPRSSVEAHTAKPIDGDGSGDVRAGDGKDDILIERRDRTAGGQTRSLIRRVAVCGSWPDAAAMNIITHSIAQRVHLRHAEAGCFIACKEKGPAVSRGAL